MHALKLLSVDFVREIKLDTTDNENRVQVLVRLYQTESINGVNNRIEYSKQLIMVNNDMRIGDLNYLSPTKSFHVTNYPAEENDYQLPYYDDGNIETKVQWNMYEFDAPVIAFMEHYKMDHIDAEIDTGGGIGEDTGFYALLIPFLKMTEKAIYDGIISNVAYDLLKKLIQLLPCIENLQNRSATVNSIRKYLDLKETWEEQYLLRKLGFDSSSNLELFMASFGYELRGEHYYKTGN